MPLTGYVDGERFIGPLLDQKEWAAVLTKTVLLHCGAIGKPKRSNLGTQFFAHWPGSHCDVEHQPESAEHLAAKEAILRAAITAGWEAEQEVPAVDRSWVADVLVTDGIHRIALEVQWTYQGADAYHLRQDRYREAGIDCYWFSRHRKTLSDFDVKVPVFLLTKTHDGFTADHGQNTGGYTDRNLPAPMLSATVTQLLTDYPRRWVPFDEHRRGVRIFWRLEPCWACRGTMSAWRADDRVPFRCLNCQEITDLFDEDDTRLLMTNPWPAEPPREFDEDVLNTARRLKNPAATTFRTTKKMPTKHHGFACPKCKAPISFAYMLVKHWNEGDFFLGLSPKKPFTSVDGGHWCQVS